LQTLVQPADVYATIGQWLGLELPQPPDWGRSLPDLAADDSSWQRDCVCSLGIGQRSIRTPGWFLAESDADDAGPSVLYAKPDDRWEANDVADLCGDVVEQLSVLLHQFQQLAKAGRFAEFPRLPERLLRGAD
jgi:hypothetical protein